MSTIKDIRRLAIVNRGEAAMRCVRAVKALRAVERSDLRCIALYTDVDQDAPFVRHADIAVRIKAPGATAVSAYLNHEVLLAALAEAGADAVWPGWGFVAEDADFADRVNEAGMHFLGPVGEVMRSLGDKIGAKRVAERAGVPVIPWSGGAIADLDDAIKTAERVGYPLMLKASAGGGGRGIRAVQKLEELEAAFRSASGEAATAFGDDRLFIERRLSGGRHIEVQIAADLHGNAIALGSRDCSVQRRHQKVLEEAPPPGMDPDLISELEQSAVRLAQAVAYSGVGTVEYLVSDGSFAFLEVNPRLQVEHGITEELTGIDLVQLQIRIGRGEEVPAVPPQRHGSCIEARVCAEDPQADFLPAPGRIVRFDPALGPRIRIDTGVAAQSDVPPDFDSLIAKVIATGDTREEAVARLRAALIDFELVVEGGATNKGFLIDLLDAPAYRAGKIDTEWLDLHPELREVNRSFSAEALVAASVLAYQVRRAEARDTFFAKRQQFSPASIPPSDGQRIDLRHDGQSYRVEVFAIGAWHYRVHLDGRVVQVTMRNEGDCRATLELDGRSLRILHDVGAQGLRVEVEGRPYRFGTEVAGQVRAGTPALVVAVQVEAGDEVEAGQSIGLLEAMKMEIGFEAPVSGRVKEVAVRAGQQVAAGELLLTIEPAGGENTRAGARVVLPETLDPLALLLGDGADQAPDLLAAANAPAGERSAAMESARDEIRRVLMGYDVNPERGEHLQAFLAAELPVDLPSDFQDELAEIRHELVLFADLEELFSRAPRILPSGETGPSNHAQLRQYVQRYDQGGADLDPDFRAMLETALTRYGSTELSPSGPLERGVLRLLASQLAPELRRSLVVGITRRLHALAEAGVDLIDDDALDAALVRIAALRGLVPDLLADRAVEARYAIFEAPRLHVEVERTTQEVAAWLDAAESEISQPPVGVLAVLAGAPLSVFDRVGRWVSDSDPRRRAVALAAHVRRLYAPTRPSAHTSASVGPVQVERLDFADGRIVLGSMAERPQLNQTLERLSRAAHAAAVQREDRKVAALEIIVPVSGNHEVESVRQSLAPHLARALPADRLTLTVLPADGLPVHDTWVGNGTGMTPQRDLHGIHPETGRRIDLPRLRHFDLERLPAPADIYCFQLRSPTIPGDERLIVLADVRTRSPKDRGQEASLHVPAFERYFFEAARCLRGHLEARDPRRRMQWNRILLFVSPTMYIDSELVEGLSRRLSPATRHLGLEKVVARINVGNRDEPESAVRPVEIVISDLTGSQLEFQWREPHREPLEPAHDYQRKVVEARRRRLAYPYEIIRMLTDGPSAFGLGQVELPGGSFEEYDLDPQQSTPVALCVNGRDPGGNSAAVVFGIIETPTDSVPEGMRRVAILSDPTVGMGSLAAPECDRIVAAIDLAERLSLPVEWIPVSSGARIAMESGTENLDATARVVRRIVTFTQAAGSIHIIVQGINVGAQSYFDALATMLQHTRGVLIMTPGASMVLTGRAALKASGSVSAEDEAAIGGFERVMGPNGEAQYFARNLAEAYGLLYQHYRYTYVVPGEERPRPLASEDRADRDVCTTETERVDGHEFDRIGEIFDASRNAERKRPFSMRALMSAVIDGDGGHLERWRRQEGADTAIVWDASLGGHPICLIGIESRNLARASNPADGPASWTGGTLFPLSSKKVARALNSASGNRPAVVLANLSGFDGSPESMRKLQLEYGAEIARAVVNFRGPLVFLVVSRYHGGAYVVFSRELNPGLRAAAVEGSFASVIGGGPAAAVVFARDARARAASDPRIVELRDAMGRSRGSQAREAYEEALAEVLLEKQAELGAEFDSIHTVERAREVGSLESLVSAARIRPFLIETLEDEANRRRHPSGSGRAPLE